MRFASLGSGSKGNSTLIEVGTTCVMVDCGFRVKDSVARLAALGKTPQDIAGVFVTHEHSDHLGGVPPLARKYDIPVWMTHGTYAASKDKKIPQLNLFEPDQVIEVGDIVMHPFTVPHDAREPCQFVVRNKAEQSTSPPLSRQIALGIVTDLGCITPHVVSKLEACDALLLECNHDVEMLANGPYPQSLKRRVGGNYGHLNNQQSLALLQHIDTEQLQRLVAVHLSDKNNCPDLVNNLLSDALPTMQDRIVVAAQDSGFPWQELH